LVEAIIGFIAGSIVTAWFFYLRSKEERWAKTPEAAVLKDLQEKINKPDLEKARYYQSARYRNDKAFCERMKRGELE